MTSSAVAAIQTAQARKAALQQQLAQARALGYTDKHPEIDRAASRRSRRRTRELTAMNKAPGEQQRRRSCRRTRSTASGWRIAMRPRLRINTLRAQIGAGQRSRSRTTRAGSRRRRWSSRTWRPSPGTSTSERARYTDLKNTYDKARSAEDLARKQGGERFSVLYPASPGAPAAPAAAVEAAGHRRSCSASCSGVVDGGRPRVHGPVGARRARAAERVRGSRPRRNPEDSPARA